jgi:hypothetical protein
VSGARLETEETAERAPGQALLLLLAGETEAGLDLYDTCLKRPYRQYIPVGLHLVFLERAGLDSVAQQLRDLALRRGGNVAVRDMKPGASPEAIAAEYEALFERGIANSRMIFRYLVMLSRLGRTDEVAALLDVDRLLRTISLDRPAPDGEAGGLATAVQALLLREEGGTVDRDAEQPLSGVPVLKAFHQLDDPAARALTAALREEADRYLRDWAASDHPLAHLVRRRFDLRAWALYARGNGYSTRHVHSGGWATGVYYPARVPGAGGDLMVGPPEELGDKSPGWPNAAIRPEPGLLVLMPSYCVHWTVPLEGPGLRTSIAFDLFDEAPRQESE